MGTTLASSISLQFCSARYGPIHVEVGIGRVAALFQASFRHRCKCWIAPRQQIEERHAEVSARLRALQCEGSLSVDIIRWPFRSALLVSSDCSSRHMLRPRNL